VAQFIWKVTIEGRPSARPGSAHDVTRFMVSVVAQTRAQAKASALAYVTSKAPYLDEAGPYRISHSQLICDWVPAIPWAGPRSDGEVIGLEVGFAGR
jgi:hypothetical protein